MIKKVYLDIESYSEAPLPKCGAHVYAEHESTQILLVGYAVENEPVQMWERGEPVPLIFSMAEDHDYTFVAHNAPFDRTVMEAVGFMPELPSERWYCTATKARSLARPSSLEALGISFGLSEEQAKLKDGKRLVKKYCLPEGDGVQYDDEWQQFIEYCVQDVASMRTLDKLMPELNYSGRFLELYALDQRINRRGIHIDRYCVTEIMKVAYAALEEANHEMSRLTNGQATTINQLKKVLASLDNPLPNLQKMTIEDALDGDLTPKDRAILETRLASSKASIKKYEAFLLRSTSDDRVKGTLMFYGARKTGRYSAMGVQPQNMIRPTMKPAQLDPILDELTATGRVPSSPDWQLIEFASSAVRSMITAPLGKDLVVADLSGIEARVLPWLAGEESILQDFRDKLDPYKVAAAGIYGVRYDTIRDDKRFIGKTAVLALGYGQGVGNASKNTGFIGYCSKQRIKMTPSFAEKIVYGWRESRAKTVSYWADTEKCARQAIKNPGKAYVCREHVVWGFHKGYLMAKLPSGRFIVWPDAHLRPGKFGRSEICYWAPTDKAVKWERQGTYGGKLVENLTQGLAYDVMMANLPLIEQAGFDIVLLVHDEVVTEVPIAATANGNMTHEYLCELMATPVSWAPGLPLAAEGYTAKRYRK